MLINPLLRNSRMQMRERLLVSLVPALKRLFVSRPESCWR